MQLVTSSVLLFLSEAALAWCFFIGLWLTCRLVAVQLRRVGLRRAAPSRFAVPSELFLARFCFFQIVFVAVWSVCFKAVLYTSLQRRVAVALLSGHQSLGIAIPAELLMAVLVLVGFATYLRRLAQLRGLSGA